MKESYWPADTTESIRDSTLATILVEAASRAPDRTAVVAGTMDPSARARWTYAEALAEATAVARALAERFAPGERIAALAPSVPESYLLSFAAAMARLVLVPVNPRLRPGEIEHILRRSGAAAALYLNPEGGEDVGDVLAAVRPGLAALREIMPLGEWRALARAGTALDRPLPPPGPEEIAQIVFTSGTSGAPKGAMLTHRGLSNSSRLSGERFDIGPGDVYVSTIPLYHAGGQAVVFMAAQALATTVLLPRFDPGLHLDLLESEQGTHTVGVPTMLQDMVADQTLSRRRLSGLRALSTGGSPVPVQLIRRLERDLGVRTTIIFGQTETCGYISQTFPDDDPADKATTVGRLFGHLEGRVVDPEGGNVVPVGALGELEVRGIGVMAGYMDEPEQTAAAIEPDGWLHTGDLVTMDDRGYLRVTGRLKDMVVSGGVNVYPAEIESVLADHPSVAAVAVIGLPHERWGEAVVAVIQPSPGADRDPAALELFARDRLAAYKIPKQWWFVSELPVTASGKVQKFLLRERLAEWHGPRPERHGGPGSATASPMPTPGE